MNFERGAARFRYEVASYAVDRTDAVGFGPLAISTFAAGFDERIFLALAPVDLRGSLAGHARRLGGDPLDGHLYVFLTGRRTLMKVLCSDRNGWVVYATRRTPPARRPRGTEGVRPRRDGPAPSAARRRVRPARRRP